MTGMEHAIEKAADVIRAAIENQADIVADGMHLDVQGVITPHWIAEALATNGLLAPAPLREEWGLYRQQGTPMPSREFAEQAVEKQRKNKVLRGGNPHLVRRLVSEWLPVDRAEGDGRADQ